MSSNEGSSRTGILVVIVLAQLAGTSLWFAGNAIVDGMRLSLGLPEDVLGPITSVVQVGFICGTLIFALLTIADRFSPSRVFFISGLAAALLNTAIALYEPGYAMILILRFLTGFCLAGIYPVGMKIAADHFPEGLGSALGFLLGALAVGTASPHLIRGILSDLPWNTVLLVTSAISFIGALAMLILVPDGPNRRRAATLDLSTFFKVFRRKEFRSAAFGYFGHMWELYAFWAFVPVLLIYYFNRTGEVHSVSLLTFGIIGIGGLSCVIGGLIALRKGSARVAFVALAGSGLCCALSPFLFDVSTWVLIVFLMLWGFFVIADSPQFSTLVASTAPRENTATALTIVNCGGFGISVFSILLLNALNDMVPTPYLMLFLLPGPVFGLIGMRAVLRNDPTQLSNQ